MSQSKSVVFGEFKSNPYLLINIVFAFFPVSFVIGSLFVNINLFLFCSLGIFYLRLKIFNDNLNFALKIISLFFIWPFPIDIIKSLKDFFLNLTIISLATFSGISFKKPSEFNKILFPKSTKSLFSCFLKYRFIEVWAFKAGLGAEFLKIKINWCILLYSYTIS